jgi:hypothetical protein
MVIFTPLALAVNGLGRLS